MRPGSRLVVGVSGGADSVALLASIDRLRRRGELPVAAAVVHVAHALRGAESAADAAFVRDRAREHGLPFFHVDAPMDPEAPNLEKLARDARIAALRGVAGAWRARFLLLAHSREDQAETFLMRLARGGGIGSLSAMARRRSDGVLRPALGVARAELRASLQEQGLAWREDSSNASDAFFRNRVRRHLMPVLDEVLGVDAATRIARLSEELAVESGLADREVERRLAGADSELPVEVVTAAAEAAGRVVHAWLCSRGVRATAAQVAQVTAVARSDSPSGRVDLPGGDTVQRRYHVLAFLRGALRLDSWGPVQLSPGLDLDLPNGMQISADGPAAISRKDETWRTEDFSDLVARSPAPGDRVRLSGGWRKLGALLIDRKVPRDLRPWLTVVERNDEILWVPGVYRRESEGRAPGGLVARHWLLESLGAC